MSEVIGNSVNMRIARHLGVLRTSLLDGKRYYDGEDYQHDMDAMHEAILTLDPAQRIQLATLVCDRFERLPDDWGPQDVVDALVAPPEELAAAFLEVADA